MTKTKYDGLYYRIDKNKNKVYVARIYINGKDTTKTLQYFYEEYVLLRQPSLSKDFTYKTTLNWNKYL